MKRKISVIEPPKDIVREDSKINQEELQQRCLGNMIIEFAMTIIENMSDEDLTFFYNNLKTIQISILKHPLCYNGSQTTKANYIINYNKIVLRQDSYRGSVDHELFHMSSTYHDQKNGRFFTGFEQKTRFHNPIAMGINEGYTQFLTKRYFDYESGLLMSYPYQTVIAEKLEMIVGKDKMESLYLNASLYGLIEELKKYADESDIMDFIYDVDHIGKALKNSRLKDKNLRESCLLMIKRIMVSKRLERVNQFLLDCYIKKLKDEFSGYSPDPGILRNRIESFLYSIYIGSTLIYIRPNLIDMEDIEAAVLNKRPLFDTIIRENTDESTSEKPRSKKKLFGIF